MSLVLSVDVGTTNIKASLVNSAGELLKVVRAPQTILRRVARAAEHDPQQLIKSIISCCHDAIQGHEQEVDLLVVSSYQYGLVVLDDQMQAISNMSTLLDSRCRRTFNDFLETWNPSEIYQRTGCPSFIQSSLPRLFYFKNREPELIQNGRYFLSSKAWIILSLTGELLTEASTESPSMLLDMEKRDWCHDILEDLGLSADMLPPIVEPLEQSLNIKTDIRKAIGLPEHCKMIPGIYDGGAICFGLNGHHPGRAVSNIGTSGMLRTISDKLVLDQSGLMRIQPFYLYDGHYLVGGATNNAAITLKWIKENLLEMEYDEIDRIAHDSPVGSNNLFFMPYITGERDINIGSICSGSFFGLREYHQRSDFVRSILEGVSFNLNMIKEGLNDSGLEINEVSIAGGGVRKADIWVDILSNVLNLTLVRSEHEEPCLLGNAILGFTYLKEHSSLQAAGDLMSKSGKKVDPDPTIVNTYQESYQFFKKLYKNFISLYEEHTQFARSTKPLCSIVQKS